VATQALRHPGTQARSGRGRGRGKSRASYAVAVVGAHAYAMLCYAMLVLGAQMLLPARFGWM
jgi:hypothetical protein